MEVLQDSPLSPVLFLIWMAPILKRMEERVRVETNLDIEIPSFVADIYTDIIDGEGCKDVETDAKRIMREVAEECRLPLETDKEEILNLRKS